MEQMCQLCKLCIAWCMLQTLVYCAKTNKIFKQDDSVDGRVCPSLQRSFTKITESIMVCSYHCTLDSSCKSLFYGQTSGACYGCRNIYTTFSTLDTETETVYYMNQVSEGLIHGHQSLSFIAKCYERNLRRGTSGYEETGPILKFEILQTIVRLSNDIGYADRGRVEVRYNGTWGTVCDDGWLDYLKGHELNNIKVLCGMFGYSNGTVLPKGSYPVANGASVPIWIDDLACDGTEASIVDCDHPGFGEENCVHSEDLSVHCHE